MTPLKLAGRLASAVAGGLILLFCLTFAPDMFRSGERREELRQ